MRGTMKNLLVYLILGFSASGIAMQKPSETTTPLSKKTTKKSQLDTPEKVKQAKLELANSIVESINGYPSEERLSEEHLEPGIFELSPKKFVERFREIVLSSFSFEEKGITAEMIEERLQEAQEQLEAGSFEKDYFDQLASPLKKEAEEIMAKSTDAKVTLLQAEHIEDHAYATTDVVVINPTRLLELASTPRKRKTLYKHECTHVKNRDLARAKALQKLLEEEKEISTFNSRSIGESKRIFS